ncbi:DMT family transporter [Pseudomonas typographi]|uniref:EamA family transporter n=1 Tax=Pseudomonas typographi TaxID=2715964 RepID=A0ABR7Z801_9PSED|nr:DMT family transporter [Pseudomonas typographi]MBD1554556.1 EamA family transporter [Pseudomonas typographi]MBD1588619.1 EamA family transporter [Pseudomonas typographi]MBD1601589.1 EamA family transporter [Pseudomonas typographi]
MLLSKTRIAEVMLLLVAFIWGTSYGVAKGALVFYPVMGFLCVRFIMTFVLLLPFLRGHLKTAVPPGLALGCILLGIFLAETYGVAQTSASNAAFLISLCVVLTPLVEWAVFRQRPTGEAIAIACLSLLGAMLLTGTSGVDMNRGDWLMILAAVLRAFMVCSTKRLMQNAQVPALALTAVQVGVVGFGSLFILLLTAGSIPALPTELSFWAASAYLVLFCTLFAFFAQNHALKHTSPTRASLLMGSEPLFGACFAVLWLNEQLTPLAWCGGVLIVVASLLGVRPQGKGKAVVTG